MAALFPFDSGESQVGFTNSVASFKCLQCTNGGEEYLPCTQMKRFLVLQFTLPNINTSTSPTYFFFSSHF